MRKFQDQGNTQTLTLRNVLTITDLIVVTIQI